MYKNKAQNGSNNICGAKIKELRQNLPQKTSQRRFADILTLEGLDLDKNAIQRIESGQRFVTDIELKTIARILHVSCDELVNEDS
ncbi:MAG: helix-turn-helix transcriptional regulator [Clostridiales bacterium]|nr:helix-turn-helix transcriptional regulator [Clostridiales bacterium]